MITRKFREQDCRDLAWAVAAVVIVDVAGQILGASRPFETMFGYLHNELVGQSLNVLLPPDSAKVHGDYIKRFCSSPGLGLTPMTLKSSVVALHKTGTKINISVSVASGYMDENQQVAIGIVGEVSSNAAQALHDSVIMGAQ